MWVEIQDVLLVNKQTAGALIGRPASRQQFLMQTFYFGTNIKTSEKREEKKRHRRMIPFKEIPFPFDRTCTHTHTHINREKLTPRCMFDVLGCLISADMLSSFAFNGIIVIVTERQPGLPLFGYYYIKQVVQLNIYMPLSFCSR